MTWICAHTGDVHVEEDRYFGDTAQCLEWFVADAIGHAVDLFVINGDLTTYKATIKERNLWIDMLIRMANHAPLVLTAGNHGAELTGDLYVYAKAKGKFPVYLCTEPEFIELDRVAIAVFPYPRKAEYVGTPEEARLQEAFVEQLEEFNQRFARRLDCCRLFFGNIPPDPARLKDARVKLVVTVAKGFHESLGREEQERLREQLLEANPAELKVKIDHQSEEPTETAAVSLAKTAEDKLRAYWRSKARRLPTRNGACFPSWLRLNQPSCRSTIDARAHPPTAFFHPRLI